MSKVYLVLGFTFQILGLLSILYGLWMLLGLWFFMVVIGVAAMILGKELVEMLGDWR